MTQTLETHTQHYAAAVGCFRCELAQAGATLPAVSKPRMDVNISFRVRRELRDAAQQVADKRGENVSDVLRAALERYVKRG